MGTGFDFKDKHALTLANYCFDDAEAPIQYQEQTFEPLFPAQNVLDPRPGRFARTTATLATEKTLVFRLGAIAENLTTFIPTSLVLMNMRPRMAGPDGFASLGTFQFRVDTGDGWTGPWVELVPWTDWWIVDGGDVFIDLNEAGLYPVRRRYWRLRMRVSASADIEAAQWGSVLVGKHYLPERNPRERMPIDFDDLNVRRGRPGGGVVVHKSHNPNRLLRASCFVNSVVEAQRLERLLRGENVGLAPHWGTYDERLNWIHAWVRPDQWKGAVGSFAAGELAKPVLGHIEKARLTVIRYHQWQLDFAFREIAGELE